MKETWILGDIHGEFEKLEKCLSNENIKKGDRIISLGDVVDRGLKSFECVELLISMRNEYEMIFIKGNHDAEFYNGLLTGRYSLYKNGCKETILSYIKNCAPDKDVVEKMSGVSTDFELEDMPVSHYEFLKNQIHYFIDENNNLFVHGGINRHHLITEQPDLEAFWWDRDLLHAARSYESMKDKTHPFKNKNNFNEIFVGHTPVQYFDKTTPQKYANIWCVDTGCGKGNHPLTIMNLDSKVFFQS